MNYILKTSLAALILASSTVFSAEPAEGWYAGFQLGASFAKGIVTSNTIHNTTFGEFQGNTYTQKISNKIGGNMGAQLGYRCNKFRYEGELNETYIPYSKKYLPSINPTPVVTQTIGIKGNSSLASALVNVFYEFYDEDYTEAKWVPYVGVGVGYADLHNVYKLYYTATDTPVGGLEKNTFSHNMPVAQGILGLDYFFSDTSSLALDFRYLSSDKIKSAFFNKRLATGSVNLVMNFSFDQPDYSL